MATIAIDYTPAYEQGGGIGRLVRDLIAALSAIDAQTDYRLFVAGATQSTLPPAPGKNFSWRPTRLNPTWLARIWQRARLPIPIEMVTGPVDLYHATDFVLPPTQKNTATLLTVHDLSFIRVPEAASPGLRAYLDRVVPRSVQQADHVLADSQATKDDLVAFYGTPESKVTVLLSGVDPRFKRISDSEKIRAVRHRYRIGNAPYIFSIGTVQPRKNYGRVVQSLSVLRQQGYDIHFVIAGGKGWLEDSIYATIEQEKMQDYVHFTGFADDDDIPALYSGSQCLVFPSLYEGFGFPVLEAMACGVPVVTSNVSSLPEVAGDATLLVDPLDVEAITNAIQRLLDDSNLRDTLIKRGYEQIKNFSWGKSARQLYGIYSQMAGI